MKTITDKSIKFLLKDNKADRPTLIYLVFRYDNKRFISSTGQTIEPYQWDAQRQRAIVDARLIKNKRERESNETINAHLERHRSALLKVLNSLQLAQVSLSNEVIMQHLDNALGRKKKASEEQAKPITFLGYIDQFVEDATSGKRLNSKSHRYAPITIKGFSKLKRTLERYNKATAQGVNYDDFTIDYYHKLKAWLTDRGLTLNYIGALLKEFKLLLKQSHYEGLHTNTVFQHRDFRRLVEEVDNVYLSSQELALLSKYDLANNNRLDRIRDLFLIGCYTGLRFSDFSELRPENITHNGQILTRKTLKTGERVSIPLNPVILSILKKYDGVPPRTITNQRMNNYLKELCQLAGFTERVEVGRTKGGLRQTRVLEKWELVTTHTARRSFATNAYLAGVPTVSIMKITGHKSESVFLKYIKISSEQNALLMLGHTHFQ
ncbi:site-specific integrase [Spirosoma foliorum]|uniref:Integrase catalytic domain-containing protein n=1 Tax=Spirosoma foliorum TaxID=2710596 RepID=A0A7G5GUD1_9BACT|nr:site-specific integrase [Spirosoma foliorum]QMW02473.1 integrase catalytic domain-containing protein [Spirosoma foliorum]